MSSNYPELVFNESDDFTADRLNAAMQVLDQRLRSLEPFSPSWEVAVNELRTIGLSRLNDAILPAYERIQRLADLGFLFAGSSTELTLVQNQNSIFTIDDETERDLFTPGPFLAITRTSTTADYAIAQFVSYDKITGELSVLIKAITGNPGPHDDWQIGMLAANTLAAMTYVNQIDAARAAAVAAKDTVVANAAQAAADRLATGQDRTAVASDKAAAQTARTAAEAAQAAAEAARDEAEVIVGGTPPASAIPFTPADTIAATNVQTAIVEALTDARGYVDGKISDLVNGAGTSLDTLNELAAALGNDASFSATITAALGYRLRFDTAAQILDTTQKSNARTNLGLGAAAVKGVATAANIRANSGSDAITTDQAWAAASVVDLGNSGSGTLNIDCNAGCKFKVTLTGNVTVNLINHRVGQSIIVYFVQDGTGNRTLSWAAGFYWPGATAPTINLTAGQVALVGAFEVAWATNVILGNGWKIN